VVKHWVLLGDLEFRCCVSNYFIYKCGVSSFASRDLIEKKCIWGQYFVAGTGGACTDS
jgi:hypothetical protein